MSGGVGLGHHRARHSYPLMKTFSLRFDVSRLSKATMTSPATLFFIVCMYGCAEPQMEQTWARFKC